MSRKIESLIGAALLIAGIILEWTGAVPGLGTALVGAAGVLGVSRPSDKRALAAPSP